MDRIAAFIDGSDYSASVCDYAAWAAGKLAMPISLVHVIGREGADSAPADLSGNLDLGARSTLLDKLSALDAERATLLRERGRVILEDAALRIAGKGAFDLSKKLRFGDLIDSMADLEAETRFTILGKRGVSAGFSTENLGSNLDRAVRGANRPVLVANRAFREPARFLFAYDGSPAAERALERMRAGSIMAGQACDIVTVGTATPQVRAKLTHAADTLRAAGFDVTEHLEMGDPETVLTHMVMDTKADQLVLGKAGHSRLRAFFIGSTTMELMRTCLVPVIIFP